jgi:hypothetical protein
MFLPIPCSRLLIALYRRGRRSFLTILAKRIDGGESDVEQRCEHGRRQECITLASPETGSLGFC